jgi:5'-methylthioadenosine phosphorylase
VVDQFFDHTRRRVSTFFGDGIVGHVALAHPVCPHLADAFAKGAATAGAVVHRGGTYICIEGPQFSTLAESNVYRSWGMDVIGMTNLQEAKLAREAEICYVTLALVTDYDCWHETHETVSADMIVANLLKSCQSAQSIIMQTVRDLEPTRNCGCSEALKYAIITDKPAIPAETRNRLDCIVGKYLA